MILVWKVGHQLNVSRPLHGCHDLGYGCLRFTSQPGQQFWPETLVLGRTGAEHVRSILWDWFSARPFKIMYVSPPKEPRKRPSVPTDFLDSWFPKKLDSCPSCRWTLSLLSVWDSWFPGFTLCFFLHLHAQTRCAERLLFSKGLGSSNASRVSLSVLPCL